MKNQLSTALVVLLGMASPFVAHAHGGSESSDHNDSQVEVIKEQAPWGIAASPGEATRTIQVSMNDTMRFIPGKITVAEGETIRFEIANDGKVMHEFVLGTTESIDQHAEMMLKFPSMEHEEPYMAHVKSGEKQEIVWTFNRAGDFVYACLIAGHYTAGMVGALTVSGV